MSCGYYCPYPAAQGKKWRSRSVDSLISEIQYLKKDFNTKSILFRTALLPCTEISTTSSPVKLLGDLKNVVTVSSIPSFDFEIILLSVALFGVVGMFEEMFFTVLYASFPETLMIANADFPDGVEGANIVSFQLFIL